MLLKVVSAISQTDLEVGVSDLDERDRVSEELEQIIKNSHISQSKHELLGYYLRLEQYYMEESIAKAVTLDTVEQGQHESSMVDDTFFIIRKCIR